MPFQLTETLGLAETIYRGTWEGARIAVQSRQHKLHSRARPDEQFGDPRGPAPPLFSRLQLLREQSGQTAWVGPRVCLLHVFCYLRSERPVLQQSLQ